MNINKKITPYNFTSMSNKKNEYIVIHYVGTVSTAADNATYFANNRLKSSAHYFVDEKEIWQCVEDTNASWHCGGGLQGSNGHAFYGKCKNSNSIGIEMCCFKDSVGNWFFKAETVKKTVELVKYLMKKHNIPIDRVIRHYDVTGKNCPAPFINESEWSNFKKSLVEVPELTSANDIVWELAHRGLISDKEGMLKEMTEKPNGRLYWLGRKVIQYLIEKEM